MDTKTAELMKLTLAEAYERFGWHRFPAFFEGLCRILKVAVPVFRDEKPQNFEGWPKWAKDNWEKHGNRRKEDWEKAECEKVLHGHTIHDLLSLLDDEITVAGGLVGHVEWIHERHHLVLHHLKEAGFTAVDSVAIPPDTNMFELLKGVSRGKLLSLHASVLNTISCVYVTDAEWKRIKGRRFTVEDVLRLRPAQLPSKSRRLTVALLKRLGFGPRNGAIMVAEKDDGHFKLMQDLVKEENLSLARAREFIEIAERRNWVKLSTKGETDETKETK